MDMERRTMRAHSGRRAHRLVHDDAPKPMEGAAVVVVDGCHWRARGRSDREGVVIVDYTGSYHVERLVESGCCLCVRTLVSMSSNACTQRMDR